MSDTPDKNAENNQNSTVLQAFDHQATGFVDATFAETLGLAMHNAITSQMNSQMAASTSVTSACNRILKSSAHSMSAPESADQPTDTTQPETPDTGLPQTEATTPVQQNDTSPQNAYTIEGNHQQWTANDQGLPPDMNSASHYPPAQDHYTLPHEQTAESPSAMHPVVQSVQPVQAPSVHDLEVISADTAAKKTGFFSRLLGLQARNPISH
ncbi:RebB family R body protein [Oceanospirillum sediminis]|uniref:RebB family R body protein n=1 Tax=Oceanospirillum sediminis TaxID=2760088 RepID=A0A839ITG0_9GAMM|nr:RebB family R body protein [Oceanospirillum sediminis]MBB1487717.1 RebB family R body protein [Oceanospirillum sediminis]